MGIKSQYIYLDHTRTISSNEDSFRSVADSQDHNPFYPCGCGVLSIGRLPSARHNDSSVLQRSSSHYFILKKYDMSKTNFKPVTASLFS